MKIKRAMIPAIAIAVLLSPAIAPAGPAAAAQAASCKEWYIIGLHGMNEGPSTTNPTKWKRSQELISFQADVHKLDPSGLNGLTAVETDLPYPTTAVSFTHPVTMINDLLAGVQKGVADLQARVKTYTTSCPGSLISMFGYSEGAWIIDAWQQKYQAEAANIYSAGVVGDPCYFDFAGDKGLARELVNSTCGTYSYLDTPILPFYSDCQYLDPICGNGYGGDISTQEAATVVCTVVRQCPHYLYVPSGDVEDIASSLLE